MTAASGWWFALAFGVGAMLGMALSLLGFAWLLDRWFRW